MTSESVLENENEGGAKDVGGRKKGILYSVDEGQAFVTRQK
ncbi:hypothetical protein [Bartonella tribocorum]|nr:hypothetical protein [Bartonella tribocorum]